ncbi:DNA polymerase Y family protein [Pseudonocardia parietis]|uniref:Protein ImuB n=1 Tax=Pseudonocardia parietis TaxID=570936 RepID=A0ABS4VPR9_9PSEU|nr:DNA polymerase Y family protein [Pseudonocardia parietis]MBP2365911.1 protein ImuB [Pseudonocardia parietis]
MSAGVDPAGRGPAIVATPESRPRSARAGEGVRGRCGPAEEPGPAAAPGALPPPGSGHGERGGRPAPDPRILALWSPDWPVTAAARAAHVPAHRPAAVFYANRVLACSAPARRYGVRRGLRRREAQARCPDLAVLAPDPGRDARLFEPVVAAVEELAPGVEVVRPGLLVLPARGPVGWFGGEQEAIERLIDQVALRAATECQVGVADGMFAAELAARRGRGVPPGRSAEFLAPLEVTELDRDPEVDRSALIDLLRRLGLRSLGAFASLPEADVASRFGADAVAAHRLARGLDPRPPVRRVPPEELAAAIELDPPVDRVDAAAFAARGLATRLHEALAGHGLACTRLGVHARTDGGEELLRVWRCAEPLTPSGTVDRVRWQLDSWLGRGGSGTLVALRLTPEDTVVAGALQRGLWGDVGENDERAGRALVRVQALLGPEAVVTAVSAGGRDPGERVRLVPWGEERDVEETAVPPGTEHAACSGQPSRRQEDPAHVRRAPGRRPPKDPPASWPGRLPAPSPATVPPEPIPVRLCDAAGAEVGLAAPDLLDGVPHRISGAGGPDREVIAWAGPWPVHARWWAPEGPGPAARLQAVLADGTALLLVHRGVRWEVTGVYD